MYKVLVADDVALNRQLIQEVLRSVARCDMVATGRQALEKFEHALDATPYDLVILDIHMPDMDGMELISVIRAREEAIVGRRRTPILVITAYEEWVAEATAHGCDAVILKPFNALVLKETVDRLIIP